MELEFVDAQGNPALVSVPFRRLDKGRYQAGNTPAGWTSRMAFGNIHINAIPVGDKTLHATFIGLTKQTDVARFSDWIEEAADAVAQLYDHFPIDHAQILVYPIGKRREAVPWAEVQRAGSPAVHLFIDETRPTQEFRDDWTLIHELSHLLAPRIDYRDRWLSEGLASYYQNVAKARAGMLSADQAWNKLKAGFAKGRRAQQGSLRASRSTKHLYWGGAAYYLLADARLRDLPQPQTLDAVLGKLYACCLPSNRLWSAESFAAKLDQLSGTRIFSDLLHEEAQRQRFPISVAQERAADSLINQYKHAIMRANVRLAQTSD